MLSRDYRDIIGGSMLVALGAFVVVYALRTLKLGTVAHLGPGMFPTALGVILACLGLMILIPALFREGSAVHAHWRSMLSVLLGILAFQLLIRPFGLAPAIAALALIATRADSKLSPLVIVLMVVALTILAVLIFVLGLGLRLNIVAWPW